MKPAIRIVVSGDPENKECDYGALAINLRDKLRREGYTDVGRVRNATQGIEDLRPKGGTVVFLSAHFCTEALRLAVGNFKIRFVVYSVGLPPPGVPIFAFRNMVTEKTTESIFG